MLQREALQVHEPALRQDLQPGRQPLRVIASLPRQATALDLVAVIPVVTIMVDIKGDATMHGITPAVTTIGGARLPV